MKTLYERGQMGPIDIQNRAFMAPLTRSRANLDGTPGDLAAEYYSQRASAGLIVTEGTQISQQGQGYIATPGIYSDAQVESWKAVVDSVHAAGGKIFLQLWHVGRISHTSFQKNEQPPVAPSAIRANADVFTASGLTPASEPRALTRDEIGEIVADYRHAAKQAKVAGFDGVEIHAANGYLIDQFIQKRSNHRDDAYGGRLENRMRFLFEVLDQVVDVWGGGRTAVRLSPTGVFNDVGEADPEETFASIIDRLNDYDLAYLHVVENHPETKTTEEDAAIIKRLRSRWNGFYVANGGYDRQSGEAAISSGHADAVAFGRLFLANPDLPYRLQNDLPLNEMDGATLYGGDAKGYTDYSTA